MYIATTDPIAAIRAEARQERGRAMPIRLLRGLTNAWQRHLERRIESAVRKLDHADVLEDFRRASRG